MPSDWRSEAPRRAVNLSINATFLVEAKSFDINLSRAGECGIPKAIADAKAARWIEENEQALTSSNTFVKTNGLPLASYRQF